MKKLYAILDGSLNTPHSPYIRKGLSTPLSVYDTEAKAKKEIRRRFKHNRTEHWSYGRYEEDLYVGVFVLDETIDAHKFVEEEDNHEEQ